MPIVRLKPFDPRRGHVLKSLIVSALDGKKFAQGSWYAVTSKDAAVLCEFMQDGSRVPVGALTPGLLRAFDVYETKEAAEAARDEETRSQLSPGSPSLDAIVAPATREGPEREVPADLPPTDTRVGKAVARAKAARGGRAPG